MAVAYVLGERQKRLGTLRCGPEPVWQHGRERLVVEAQQKANIGRARRHLRHVAV